MSTETTNHATAPDGTVLCLSCGAVLKNEKNIKRHQKTKPCRERAASMDDTSVLEPSWNCRGTDWEGLVGTRFVDIKANLSKASEAFMDALKPKESEEEAAEPESPPHETPKVAAPEPTVIEVVRVAPPRVTTKLVHQKAPVTPATEILVHQKQETGAPVPEAKTTRIAKPRRWKNNLPQALAWLAETLDLEPAEMLTLGQRQYRYAGARGLWFALGNRRAEVTATIERLMPQVVEYYNDAMKKIETRCDGGTIRARWVEYSCNVCGKTSERHDSRPAATPRTCCRCYEKAEREERESAGKQDWRWVEIKCPFCGGLESYHDDLSLASLRWCDLCKAHVRTRAREMTDAEVTAAMCGPETRCDGGQPTVTMRCDGCKKEVNLTQDDADRYLPAHNRRCPRCDRGTFRVVEATA